MNNKYIKKSVEIEAIQWNGNNLEEIMEFLHSEFSYTDNTEYVTKKFSYYKTTNNLYINTLEGSMKATIGDYIIKGIKGEYYPCKPDIFELTYEKVYTLEEIKQEWEDAGFEIISCSKERFEVYKQCIERYQKTSHHTFAKVVIDKDYFYIVGQFSNEYTQLLTKTFKALGWEG